MTVSRDTRIPLACVCRAGNGDPRLIDRAAIDNALGLTHDQQVLLSQTVGYHPKANP